MLTSASNGDPQPALEAALDRLSDLAILHPEAGADDTVDDDTACP